MNTKRSAFGLIVSAEPSDAPLYSERAFWHAVKTTLNRQTPRRWLRPLGGRVPGLNSVPHSLRERGSGRYIYDDAYAVRLAHQYYRQHGRLDLSITA